jgi:predicted N-acyltransferase
MAYSASIVDSLSRFTDEELQAVTGHADIFLDWRYLRMCERIDLAEACRGALAFRFVAVTSGGALVALCPFLVTRSPSILYPYSLEKLYFTSWQDQLLRINPESASWIRYAVFGANAYRQFVRRIGTGIEGLVLVTSPMSTRGGVACREAEDTERVHDAVIEALKGVASDERLPLCFNAIPESSPLAGALGRAGFAQVFYVFDNELTIGDGGIEGYLKQFAPKVRRNFKAEMRFAEKAGYRFELCRNLDPIKTEITDSYSNTYGKYGEEYFVHPASFWTKLAGFLDANVETIIVRKGDRFAGFTTMLHKGDEMYVYRLGRVAHDDGEEPPIYFDLMAWQPIKRAAELGKKRIWLASGAWEAKRHRGAHGRPFYRHFWFPSTRSRLLLGPFVSVFARINRAQVSRKIAS